MRKTVNHLRKSLEEFDWQFAFLSGFSILILGGVLYLGWGNMQAVTPSIAHDLNVFTKDRIVLPIVWGDYGKKLTENGTIDKELFVKLYESRGGITPEMRQILEGTNNGKLVMTPENAGFLLNVLWGYGLANESQALTKGPMMETGEPGYFASTGGWTLGKGDALDHYAKHKLTPLTEAQEALVKNVAENIYRPCCGNSTYFPDCNHGMALLGLIELMAVNGVSEEDMYKVALQVQAMWFQSNYRELERYFEWKKIDLATLSPKEILGKQYSSGPGFYDTVKDLPPDPNAPKRSASCGA